MSSDSALLRIYTDEEARKGDHLVYRTIIDRGRLAGLSGATVLRGVLGLGGTSRMHAAEPLKLSSNLPVVIEIVDEPGKLRSFVGILADLPDVGLITLEKVEILRRHAPT